MRNLKFALPALLLALSLNAYCDGDAFREEDSLKASSRSGSGSGAPTSGISSASSGISDTGSAGTASSRVVEMPFFSQEEKEVPPLETEVYPEDESGKLTMTPEEAHDQYILDSRPAWYKRMPWGLCRGFVNLVTCPGELGRGFTYAFGDYNWALAVPAGLIGGVAGTLGRCGAGVADILTLGFFGDRDLAENFPDYVWQGQWDYGLYGQKQSAPAAETAEPDAPREDLGEGYIPSPTARTPLKARRASER